MAEGSGPREVLVVTHAYPPAFQRGGPARSVSSIVEELSSDLEFAVVASAFDAAGQPPMDVAADEWLETPSCRVRYLGSRRPGFRAWWSIVKADRWQLMYLNSLFHPWFAVAPLAAWASSRMAFSTVVAPRGELGAGALAIRRRKKAIFIRIFRLLRLHRKVAFHATSAAERDDIIRQMGDVKVFTAAPLRTGLKVRTAQQERSAGQVQRCVFLSRISPKKNLDGLINAWPHTNGGSSLTVAGPVDDREYWRTCQERAVELGVDLDYAGTVLAAEVSEFLAGFDLFVLPTHGENFGHVILEALAAGLPVVIGRDTPWSEVEELGCGSVCEPGDKLSIAGSIDAFSTLSEQERERATNSAIELASRVLNDSHTRSDNLRMFNEAGGNLG